MSDELVAGRRAVAEALRAGDVAEVLVAAGAKDTPGMREVREAAGTEGVPVRSVPRRELDALAPDHRGVVARLRARRPALTERDLSTFPFPPDALVVVLDGIDDPQNLGACARSAEAAGASMLVTRARRAAGVTPAARRASAGALAHLPLAVVANIPRAIQRLQAEGFFAIGLDGGAPSAIYDDELPSGRLAVVVGAEGAGLSRLARERCDVLVSLPMSGRVGSLNASASLAAALWGAVVPSRRRTSDA